MTLDSYKKSVAEFFDARANYSRSELHARMADRLLRLAALQPGERLLDIATGTGFVSIPAARLVGVQGIVVGVDISSGMLEQARQAIATARLQLLGRGLACDGSFASEHRCQTRYQDKHHRSGHRHT